MVETETLDAIDKLFEKIKAKKDPKVSEFPWHQTKEAKQREREMLEFFANAPEDCFIKDPNHADWQKWLQIKGYTSPANKNRNDLSFSMDKYFTYLMNRPDPTPVIVERKPHIPHQPTLESFNRIFDSLAKLKSKETP